MNSYILGKGSTVSIGKPAEYPADMVKALTAYFEKNDSVNGASLAWKVQNNEAGYLLVIDSEEKPQVLMPPIGEICQSYLGEYPLDITYKSTGLGEYVFSEIEPFYVCEKSNQ